MWIQTLVRTRAFRIFERSCAILTALYFVFLTWRVSPEYKGAFALVTTLTVAGAALTWYRTRATVLAGPKGD